jgi:hypothetical protein
MIIMFRKSTSKAKKAVGRFRVTASEQGVCFHIDHQSFNVSTSADEKETKKEKLRINKWYAKQLRIALKRLKGSGR